MRAIVLLLSFCFATSVIAEVLQNPYLFEIQKDGQRSYIFGIAHYGFTLDDLPEFVRIALLTRDVFVSESGVFNDGRAVTADFSGPPLNDFALQRMRERGMSEKDVANLSKKPKAVCTWYVLYEGLQNLPSLDTRLYQYAKKFGKTLRDLDDPTITNVTQNFLDKCDFNKMAQETTPAQARAVYEELLLEYRRGDLIPEEGNPEVFKERNEKWLPRILEVHKEGAFIAVGHGHLAGEQGLLNSLAKEGFKIRRIIRQEDF